MGEIEENWQSAKFYCSEIKLIYSNKCRVHFFFLAMPTFYGENFGGLLSVLHKNFTAHLATLEFYL